MEYCAKNDPPRSSARVRHVRFRPERCFCECHLEAELFHSRTSNFYQSSNEGKYTGPPDLVLPRFFTILKDNLRYKDIDLLLNIVACQINDSL